MTVLLAVVLSPISFSGSQTSSIPSLENKIAMEGETLTITANDGSAYYWYIGVSNQKYLCNTETALKYGVEFSGGTSKTLVIKNINIKINDASFSCMEKEQPTGDNRYFGTLLYFVSIKVEPKKTQESNVSFFSTTSAVKSEMFNPPVPKPEYNLTKTSVNPGENVEMKVALALSDSEKGKLTYQWYESTKDDPDEAKAISGATAEAYTVSGNAHSGTTCYYFCKITNDLNGEKYTNMDSLAMVEVTFAGQHIQEYGEWKVTTEATCTDNGTKTRTCKCGDKQHETISLLGHTYGEWAVKTAATESTEGQEERSCIKCGSIETRVITIAAVQSTDNATDSIITQPAGFQNTTSWWLLAIIVGSIVAAILIFIVKRKVKK